MNGLGLDLHHHRNSHWIRQPWRGLAFAPYADMLWFESSNPDLSEAQAFDGAIHAPFPSKLLAYDCSPSFNWRHNMGDDAIAGFQRELAQMGYKFQFITLAGWHMTNLSAFELAAAHHQEGMTAYVRLQDREFALEEDGYTAAKHQQEVGASYFDQVLLTVTGGEAATAAPTGSTGEKQFGLSMARRSSWCSLFPVPWPRAITRDEAASTRARPSLRWKPPFP